SVIDTQTKTNYKRLGISILLGAVLGILCIIGVGSRVGMTGNEWYLFGMWYNRVVMGVLIGFAGSWQLIKGGEKDLKNAGVRGLILGTIVTSAIFFSTGLKDVPAWFAGIAYGVIIDVVATHFSN
ncbi:MAG: hypothetical protein R6U44_03520, partial [Archaeoglobaceae archaeon]